LPNNNPTRLIPFSISSQQGAVFVGAAVNPAIAQSTNAVTAQQKATIATLHAEYAQIYECKAASDGNLAWQRSAPPGQLASERAGITRLVRGGFEPPTILVLVKRRLDRQHAVATNQLVDRNPAFASAPPVPWQRHTRPKCRIPRCRSS
jgi:predicted Zn-dependent protease